MNTHFNHLNMGNLFYKVIFLWEKKKKQILKGIDYFDAYKSVQKQ